MFVVDPLQKERLHLPHECGVWFLTDMLVSPASFQMERNETEGGGGGGFEI